MVKYLMAMALAALTAAALSAGASAAPRKPVAGGTPAQMQRLLSCRSVADAVQRLACFDRESTIVDAAVARKDLVFIDRERATAARRSLFGFSVPSFGGLLGGDEKDEVKQVDGVVASSRRNADGGWIIVLGDKSVWSQTDDTPLALAPKAGQKVVVRRGVLGSFRLSVNGQPGLKVKRVG